MGTSSKIIPSILEQQDESELPMEVFRTRTDIIAPPPLAKVKTPSTSARNPDLQHLLQDLSAGVEKFSLLDGTMTKTHEDLLGLTRELRLMTERNLDDRAKNGKITGASLLLLEELKKLGERTWQERHETVKTLEESRAEVAHLSGVVAKATSDFSAALVELKFVNDSAVSEVRERQRVFDDLSVQLPQLRAECASLVQQLAQQQKENQRLTESTTALRQEEAVLRIRLLALQDATNRSEIAAIQSREEEGRAADLAQQATIRSDGAQVHLHQLEATLQDLSMSHEQLTTQIEQSRRELKAQRESLVEVEHLKLAQTLALEEVELKLKQQRHHLSRLEEEKIMVEERHANMLERLRLEQLQRSHEAEEKLLQALAQKQEHITTEALGILVDIIDDTSLSSRAQKSHELRRRLAGLLAPSAPAGDQSPPRLWLLGAAMSVSMGFFWLGSLF
jgi:hypothetical protein